MKASYGNAAAQLAIRDVKTDPALLDQAKTLFAAKYPEYAHEAEDPEFVEDFEAQLSDDGFFYALVDPSTNEVKGFTAGVIFESNTAALTYNVVPNDAEGAKRLKDTTLAALKDREVKAVYVELLNEDSERNNIEKAAFKQMGTVLEVPVDYKQPLLADSDVELTDIDLHVLFTGNPNAAQKSAITLEHFDAYTRYYDADLENPNNVATLASYKESLAGASWGAAAKPGIKKDI